MSITTLDYCLKIESFWKTYRIIEFFLSETSILEPLKMDNQYLWQLPNLKPFITIPLLLAFFTIISIFQLFCLLKMLYHPF